MSLQLKTLKNLEGKGTYWHVENYLAMDLVVISLANEQNFPRQMLVAPYVGSNWPQFLLVGEFVGANIKVCREALSILSFDNVNKEELFRTIKEIDKILLNSISYISHNIFNPFLTHYSIDIYFDTSTTGSF